jgi:uncharacterized protein involved in cysteine biosynthesis
MPIIPIPIHHGHSAPLTPEAAKTLVGCLIVLTVIWMITYLISAIRYYITDKDVNKKLWTFYDYHSDYFGLLDILMTVFYGLLILVWLGSLVAKLL